MDIQLDDWAELEPEEKKAAYKKVPVRFGVLQFRPTSPRRGRVLLLQEVIDQLHLQTWRVDVRIGKGPNEGKLAIVPNRDGRFEISEVKSPRGKGSFRLNLPHIESWTGYPCPMGEADWTIGEIRRGKPALFIELPAPLVNKSAFAAWKSVQRAA